MDLAQIPRVFWYSVSAAIIIVTITFSWTAFQSRGMTIEIANAKIAVTGQLGELERINDDLKLQLANLKQAKKELETRLAKLEREGNNNTTRELRSLLESTRTAIKAPDVNEEALQKNADKITDIRKSLMQQQIAR
jgi:hypothetical protein